MKVPVPHLNDPYLQKVPQALMRAFEKARQLTEQTGTPFVVRKSPTLPAKTGKYVGCISCAMMRKRTLQS